MLMLTTSGISRHQSRTILKRSRSHDGSAMMLTATVMSSERAYSSASKFLESVTRLRYRFSPSSSIASSPRNMVFRPSRFQSWNTSFPQQYIAARLEIIAFPDATPRDRLGDLHTVLGLDECNIVRDENAGLADLRQLFHCAFRCLHAVVAAVERLRAAKNAVPRATSAEFDGGGRVELADKIFP